MPSTLTTTLFISKQERSDWLAVSPPRFEVVPRNAHKAVLKKDVMIGLQPLTASGVSELCSSNSLQLTGASRFLVLPPAPRVQNGYITLSNKSDFGPERGCIDAMKWRTADENV